MMYLPDCKFEAPSDMLISPLPPRSSTNLDHFPLFPAGMRLSLLGYRARSVHTKTLQRFVGGASAPNRPWPGRPVARSAAGSVEESFCANQVPDANLVLGA